MKYYLIYCGLRLALFVFLLLLELKCDFCSFCCFGLERLYLQLQRSVFLSKIYDFLVFLVCLASTRDGFDHFLVLAQQLLTEKYDH